MFLSFNISALLLHNTSNYIPKIVDYIIGVASRVVVIKIDTSTYYNKFKNVVGIIERGNVDGKALIYKVSSLSPNLVIVDDSWLCGNDDIHINIISYCKAFSISCIIMMQLNCPDKNVLNTCDVLYIPSIKQHLLKQYDAKKITYDHENSIPKY